MATQARQVDQVRTGPGRLYIAPVGSTEPTTLTGALNAAWVDLGYTETGSEFEFEIDIEDVMVAEEKEPLKPVLNGRSTQISVNLAEMTATNLQRALNGGTITSGSGYVTFEPPDADDDLTFVALLWQSQSPDSGAPEERWIFRKCLQVDSVTRENRKGADYAKYTSTFKTYKPDSGKHWVLISAHE